jgi:hypothetical protein
MQNVKGLLVEDFAQTQRCLQSQKSRGKKMNGKAFGCRATRQGRVAAGHQLRVVTAFAEPSQCEKNLQLAAAPIRARVEVEDFHEHASVSHA